MPRDATAARPRVTSCASPTATAACGCCRADEERGALLLERLGPSLSDLGVPIDATPRDPHRPGGRVWRPAADAGLPTGADKAAWLAAAIAAMWERLDRPCSERTVAHALECAERAGLAHDPATARLVHGDVHQWNALQSRDRIRARRPGRAVRRPRVRPRRDHARGPAGTARRGPAHARAWLAARTGTDEAAIWEWGVVERVSTGLLATEIGLQPIGGADVAAADVIAAVDLAS